MSLGTCRMCGESKSKLDTLVKGEYSWHNFICEKCGRVFESEIVFFLDFIAVWIDCQPEIAGIAVPDGEGDSMCYIISERERRVALKEGSPVRTNINSWTRLNSNNTYEEGY